MLDVMGVIMEGELPGNIPSLSLPWTSQQNAKIIPCICTCTCTISILSSCSYMYLLQVVQVCGVFLERERERERERGGGGREGERRVSE